MNTEFDLNKLSKLLESLKEQADNPIPDYDKRMMELAHSATSIREVFEELKSVVPEEEIKAMDIEAGLLEIDSLMNAALEELEKAKDLRDTHFKGE
jgi:hypothetical protein